jgi:hypothetical protein
MTSQKRKLIGPKEFKGVSIKIKWHQDTKIETSVSASIARTLI